MIDVTIPGYGALRLDYLVLDHNGTLAVDGILAPGVREGLEKLAEKLEIFVVTADTFGRARAQLEESCVSVDDPAPRRSGPRQIGVCRSAGPRAHRLHRQRPQRRPDARSRGAGDRGDSFRGCGGGHAECGRCGLCRHRSGLGAVDEPVAADRHAAVIGSVRPEAASFGPGRRSHESEILNVAELRLRFQIRCGLGLNQNLLLRDRTTDRVH